MTIIDSTLFDFSKPNIFLSFFKGDYVVFVYSDLNGLKHLENVIQKDPLFFNMITVNEVIVKMSCEISFNFSSSSSHAPWNQKAIHITPDKYVDFVSSYLPWKKQLEMFFGSDNLHEVVLDSNKFDEFMAISSKTNPSNKGEALLNFLEYQRLRKSLNYRENTNNKLKI